MQCSPVNGLVLHILTVWSLAYTFMVGNMKSSRWQLVQTNKVQLWVLRMAGDWEWVIGFENGIKYGCAVGVFGRVKAYSISRHSLPRDCRTLWMVYYSQRYPYTYLSEYPISTDKSLCDRVYPVQAYFLLIVFTCSSTPSPLASWANPFPPFPPHVIPHLYSSSLSSTDEPPILTLRSEGTAVNGLLGWVADGKNYCSIYFHITNSTKTSPIFLHSFKFSTT
jgi:hypothetical protein